MFVEIVHSGGNINLLKTFNAERYASLNIGMGQTNEVIAQVGRLIKSKTGPFAAVRREAHDADGNLGVERHRAELPRRASERCACRTRSRSSTGSC